MIKFSDLKVGMLVQDTWWPDGFGVGQVVLLYKGLVHVSFDGHIGGPLVYDREHAEQSLVEWKHSAKKEKK